MQGTMFPAGVWGKAPIVPQKSEAKRKSGSEAIPDLLKACFNHREVFRDETDVYPVSFFLNAYTISVYEKSGQKPAFLLLNAVPSLPHRGVGQFAVGVFLFQIINDPDAAVCA